MMVCLRSTITVSSVVYLSSISELRPCRIYKRSYGYSTVTWLWISVVGLMGHMSRHTPKAVHELNELFILVLASAVCSGNSLQALSHLIRD